VTTFSSPRVKEIMTMRRDIAQSIEDAVGAWVQRLGRKELVDAIENGQASLDAICRRFEDAVRSELGVSGDDR
jgi:hypothetical protein